jgi:hypothetical protein
MSEAPGVTGIGSYLGTEMSGRWWKRYRAPGFFVRGRGRFWFEGGELRFHRDLTKELTRIPLDRVRDVSIGTWHAGKWFAGRPIVKLEWERDGERLSSGFGFGDRVVADALVAELHRRLHGPGDQLHE